MRIGNQQRTGIAQNQLAQKELDARKSAQKANVNQRWGLAGLDAAMTAGKLGYGAWQAGKQREQNEWLQQTAQSAAAARAKSAEDAAMERLRSGQAHEGQMLRARNMFEGPLEARRLGIMEKQAEAEARKPTGLEDLVNQALFANILDRVTASGLQPKSVPGALRGAVAGQPVPELEAAEHGKEIEALLQGANVLQPGVPMEAIGAQPSETQNQMLLDAARAISATGRPLDDATVRALVEKLPPVRPEAYRQPVAGGIGSEQWTRGSFGDPTKPGLIYGILNSLGITNYETPAARQQREALDFLERARRAQGGDRVPNGR